MKHKHLWALLIAVIPSECFSQAELNDSVSLGHIKFEGISMDGAVKPDSVSGTTHTGPYHFEYTPAVHPLFPYTLAKPLDLHIPSLRECQVCFNGKAERLLPPEAQGLSRG